MKHGRNAHVLIHQFWGFMRMKRFFGFIFIILFSTIFFSCEQDQQEDTIIFIPVYTITLQNDDGILFDTLFTEENNYTVDLPVMSKEGYVFLGWSDGLELFNTTYEATGDQTLIATYESLYLEYTTVKDETFKTVAITAYTGNETNLKIPEFIQGYLVTVIGYQAFQDSLLEEVEIPASVILIDNNAFAGSASLETVSFYGDYQGHKEMGLSQDEYDLIINANPEACVITSGTIETGVYTLGEGCPISEVESITSIVIFNVTYSTYHAIVDLKYYDQLNNVEIRDFAFSECESLISVALPSRLSNFNPRILEGSNSISDVSIYGDSGKYQVIDQVMYSNDQKELVYYPGGLTQASFVIPNMIDTIAYQAFNNNFLQSIEITEQEIDISINAFAFATALEQFMITVVGSEYHVIEGVLFKDTTLISYPANKTGSSYVVPAGTSRIYDYAFANNQNLESLDLGDQVTWIESYAFMGTQKLIRMDIPSSVLNLDDHFTMNSSIEIMVIHRSKVIDGTMTMIGFTNSPLHLPVFYVPDDSYDDYLNNYGWNYVQAVIHPVSELIE